MYPASAHDDRFTPSSGRKSVTQSSSAYTLGGSAFALPEYYAPCFPNNGSLLLIMFRISQNAQNILLEPQPDISAEGLDGRDSALYSGEAEYGTPWRRTGPATFVVQELPLKSSPVTSPRVSLIGNLTLISDTWLSASNGTQSAELIDDEVEACYLERHPDAKWWIPGKGAFHVRPN